jgi:hypothetical protein
LSPAVAGLHIYAFQEEPPHLFATSLQLATGGNCHLRQR